MAKVSKHNGTLNVKLGFWESIGALYKSFSIDMDNIADVQAIAKPTWQLLGWRLAGTHLPAVVALGHFRKSKKRMMVLWTRGKEAVIIDLKAGSIRRIIIGVDDAQAFAKSLKK